MKKTWIKSSLLGLSISLALHAQALPLKPQARSIAGERVDILSPFDDIPESMKETVSIKVFSARPHIMFVIDDSGSMISNWMDKKGYFAFTDHFDMRDKNVFPWYVIKPQYANTYFSYLETVKNALRKVMQTYADQALFNVRTIYDIVNEDGITFGEPVQSGFANSPVQPNMQARIQQGFVAYDTPVGKAALDKIVNEVYPYRADAGTPATVGVISVAEYMRRNIDLVCRNQVLVFLSDGASNNGQGWIRASKRWTNDNPFVKYYNSPANIDSDEGFMNSTQNGEGLSYFTRILAEDDFRPAGVSVANALYPDKDKEGNDWDGMDVNGEKLFAKQEFFTYTVGLGAKGYAYSSSDGCNQGKDRLSWNTTCYYDSDTNKWVLPVPKNDGQNYSPDYLQNAAVAGRGAFLEANDPDALTKAFEDILEDVITNQQEANATRNTKFSFSKAALISTGIDGFAGSLDLNTKEWASKLVINKTTSDGGTLETDSKGEPIKLSIDYSSYDANKVIYAKSDNSGFAPLKNLTLAELNLTCANGETPDDGEFNYYKKWLLREDTDTSIQAGAANITQNKACKIVDTYRIRSDEWRMMGDVMNAPVVAIDQDKDSKRARYVLTSSNDGMTHIFKATADDNKPYAFAMNYVPFAQREGKSNTLVALGITAENGYGTGRSSLVSASGNYDDAQLFTAKKHIYLNDGGIAWRKTSAKTADGKQEVVALAATGRGGRGIYALKIAGKSRIDGRDVGLDSGDPMQVPLWNEDGAQAKLGYTIGTPQIGLVGKKDKTELRQYAFVGTGYVGQWELDDKGLHPEAGVAVFDLLGQEMGSSGAKDLGSAGNYLGKVPLPASGVATPRLVDNDLDGVFDWMYVGTEGGDVFKIMIEYGKSPQEWGVEQIYQGERQVCFTKDNLGINPITTQPAVYRKDINDYIVIFGTGSAITYPQGEGRVVDGQYINARPSDPRTECRSDFERNRGLRHRLIGVFDNANRTGVVGVNDLVKQTITTSTTDTNALTGETKEVRYVSNNPVSDSDKGWSLELDDIKDQWGVPGWPEQITTDPSVLLSTVYVTTSGAYTSSSDSLSRSLTGEKARLYQQEVAKARSAPDTCKIDRTVSESSTVSYILSVDVKTGGSPSADSSYLAGWKKENNGQLGSVGNIVSSVKMSGAASALEIISPYKPQSAIDPNGGGQSGEDDINPGRNDCVDSDTYRLLMSDQSGLHSDKLHVKLCPKGGGRLIRINVREPH